MSDDLISRKSAVEAICTEREWIDRNIQSAQPHYYLMNETAKFLHIIGNLPATAPVQKIGRWLINSDGYYPYCSNCKNEPQGRVMTKYCPNCGAKMEGEI